MKSKSNLHKNALSIVLTLFMSFAFFAVTAFAEEEPGGDTPQTYLVTVNGGTGSGSYEATATVNITATVPDGQVFVNWTTESNGVNFVDSVSQTTSFPMPANEVTVTANFAYPAPNITIDYDTETLTGFTAGGTYTIGGTAYENITETVAIEAGWFGTTVDIAQADSLTLSLPILARPTLPVFGIAAETSFNANDAQITGLNSGTIYQYSTDQINWTDISGAEQISSLASGTYYVRIKATSETFASMIATATISSGAFNQSLVLSDGVLKYNGTEAIAAGVLSPGSYSFSENTLTLTNVNYTTSAEIALDLTAVLAVTFNINGTNTITSAYIGTSSTYGIETAGSITIEGSGSLAVTGGTSSGGNSTGINGNVTVNSGNFSAEGNTNAISSTPTVNVAKYNWMVGISGSQYPISTPDFTGATSISITTLTGVNPETTTYNKYVGFDDIDIRYSLANGDTLQSISYGDTTLVEDEDYSISGNTVTFPYEYISTLPNAGATLTFNTSGTTDPTVAITFNNVPATNEYGLVLTDGGVLQINGIAATPADLGGGSYSYANGTLTLTNVNFTTTAAIALNANAISPLYLVINGTNSIVSTYNGSFATYAIDAGTALTISGTGSLTATAGTTLSNSSGIDVEYTVGTLTLNGGNVTASGGTSAVRGNVTINMPSYSWTADDSGGTYPDNALTVTHLSSQNAIAITTLTAVSPTAVDNVNIFSTPADIPITYSLLNGTTLDSITNGENTLTESTHYTVANNIVTIKGSYLRTLSVGTQTLTFNTSGTTDPTVTLNVINRNPAYTYYDLSECTEDPDITVTSGQTVVVVGTKGSSASPANFGLTFNIEAGGNVIWDDAVFTTSVEYAVRVNGYSGTKGNFELKSGEINAKRTSYSVYALSNNANLTITGGTVSASGDSFTYGISNNTGASLTINDGLISVNSSFWSYGIWNQGTVLINGGIIAATGNGNGSDAFTNNGTVTVKGDAAIIGITNISAGTVPVSISENAVSILYDKTMTSPVIYSTGGLTLANGGSAVWNKVNDKYGISWKKGTNSGFFEIDGVTTTQNADIDATIDISFIDSNTIFSVTGSKTLTVTGENTSADFFLRFNITSGCEVIWDGAEFVSTATNAVGIFQNDTAGDFTMNSGLIAGTVLINSINADIGGTIIAVDPFTGPTPPVCDGEYVVITLPDPIGTYTKGTSTDLTVEPAEATAIWDIQGGKQGVSWTNGTNAGFLEISGASVSNPPAPEPEDNSNSGSPDVAMPPRNEHIKQDEDEDTDDSNKESNTNLKVNGEMSDTSVAMPTEPGDKTADVKIDGETIETYSLTAAEAIADGEVREAFVSETGAIAAVTTGGNVIAGANSTESLNSASTIAALKKAVEEAAATVTEDSEVETSLITITAGQEVTGVSDNTLEKIIAVSEESGIDTQIQKRQYSENENGQIDELIYRITIPVVSDNIQDIHLGAEFSTAVVEAAETAFEKTFGNTDCAGFALTQKDSFGTEATIQVRMSAIGFEGEAGDTVYVAIFNPTTGRYTQVEGRVGESGFITFKTDKSGVVVISATPFEK
jgi:hypothetical protein